MSSMPKMTEIGKGIPKFKPVDQNYSRRKDLYTKEEWLNKHEMTVSETYEALRQYVNDNNIPILDNCSYVDFCDFVAERSSRRKEYYD